MKKNTLVKSMKFGALSMLTAMAVSTLPIGATAHAAEPMNRGIETGQVSALVTGKAWLAWL